MIELNEMFNKIDTMEMHHSRIEHMISKYGVTFTKLNDNVFLFSDSEHTAYIRKEFTEYIKEIETKAKLLFPVYKKLFALGHQNIIKLDCITPLEFIDKYCSDDNKWKYVEVNGIRYIIDSKDDVIEYVKNKPLVCTKCEKEARGVSLAVRSSGIARVLFTTDEYKHTWLTVYTNIPVNYGGIKDDNNMCIQCQYCKVRNKLPVGGIVINNDDVNVSYIEINIRQFKMTTFGESFCMNLILQRYPDALIDEDGNVKFKAVKATDFQRVYALCKAIKHCTYNFLENGLFHTIMDKK